MLDCLLEFMERSENFFLSGLCWILLGLGVQSAERWGRRTVTLRSQLLLLSSYLLFFYKCLSSAHCVRWISSLTQWT